MKAIKVRELNKYIKKYIAMDYLLSNIDIEGEISNLTKHSNGNYYLTLKDENTSVKCIIYYTDVYNLDCDINNGDSIIASGAVSVFEKDASITFFIRKIKHIGSGDVKEAYERLKEKLKEEGLFDKDKKFFKAFPEKIGVVTSPTGAAIQDIINVLHRRNPAVDIILFPTLVQGEGAEDSILKGLEFFESSDVDTVILGRGGGAYEDLVAFNDERIARYIYSMDKPVISAVGHEVDFVISDFVADLRASTPSAAAEIVSLSKDELSNYLDVSFNTIKNSVIEKIKVEKKELEIEKLNFSDRLNNQINNKKNEFFYQMKNLNIIIKRKENYNYILNDNLKRLNSNIRKNFNTKNMDLISIKNHLKLKSFDEYKNKITEIRDLLLKNNLENKLCNEFNNLEESLKVINNDINKNLEIEKTKIKELRVNTNGLNLQKKLSVNGIILNRTKDLISLKTEKILDKKRNSLLINIQKLNQVKFSDIYAKDENGKVISNIKDISMDQVLEIHFHDGTVKSRVFDMEEN